MAQTQRTRPRIGDVVRITSTKGDAAIAQYTHKHAQYGALLRVIGPATEPLGRDDATAQALAARPAQFVTFFPLGSACQRGIAEILGAAPIPPDAEAFPLFRTAVRDANTRGPWWLWDGVREWCIGELTPEQCSLPIRGVVNDTLLVERAHAGWRHEHDV